MGDGTKENPYTRDDVLKLIKEHDNTAEGLDLSEKWFEREIDLHELNLKGIILDGAVLGYAHLEGTYLVSAHLEGADLWSARLEGAYLGHAHLEGADLEGAHLEGADLRGARLERAVLEGAHLEGAELSGARLEGAYIEDAHLTESPSPHLGDADWGNYKIGEETSRDFHSAERRYRHLKMWYTNSGYYDIAAKFYYREKEAARKGAKRRRDRYALQLFRFLFGYGERWWNIVGWIAGFVIFFALVYFAIGTFIPSWGMLCPDTFLDILYYSAASFIALGYGSWVKEATGLIKIVGVLETFLGFFMMTLLLVTFVRKWTR